MTQEFTTDGDTIVYTWLEEIKNLYIRSEKKLNS